VVPLLQGLLADRIGIQHAFVLPMACYAYIAWYGLRGSRAADPLPVPAGADGAGANPAAGPDAVH
jgi:FHS family L-fucose permease-like MFS transporter